MTGDLLLLVVVAVAVVPTRVIEAVDRARARAACSHKELALSQGISQKQWSQELHGQGHIALDRLDATPAPFRAALLEELALAWGLPTLVTPAQVLDLIRQELRHA